MTEKVKFVTITRTIDDRKGIHYLDAIDVNGNHKMFRVPKTDDCLCSICLEKLK